MNILDLYNKVVVPPGKYPVMTSSTLSAVTECVFERMDDEIFQFKKGLLLLNNKKIGEGFYFNIKVISCLRYVGVFHCG